MTKPNSEAKMCLKIDQKDTLGIPSSLPPMVPGWNFYDR